MKEAFLYSLHNSRLFARVLFNNGVALHGAAVVTDLLAQAVTQGGSLKYG